MTMPTEGLLICKDIFSYGRMLICNIKLIITFIFNLYSLIFMYLNEGFSVLQRCCNTFANLQQKNVYRLYVLKI
jgi:hypothetical protein